MRKRMLGVGIAALAMSLVAPFATAQDLTVEETPEATAVQETAPVVQATETAPAPTPTPTPTETAPAPTPTPTPTPAPLTPEQAVYVVPGYHKVNGRYWWTECEKYSSNTVRCTTDIYASTVYQKDGAWYSQNTWVFNNLTYLPSPRHLWANNPLGGFGEVGRSHSWTATDGRKWRTECDTSKTGRGACRNYAVSTTASLVNGRVVQSDKEVFNGIVRFEGPGAPWQKTIPATATPPAGIPKPSAAVRVYAANPLVQQGFRLDRRCLTGRTFCVSMNQNKMAWVVDGKVQKIVDVRFGKTATPTRKGAFKIYRKSRDHFSSIYKVPMPFALFFDGGIAIHYSADFARRGYSGGSGGCVNVRDYAQMEKFFSLARVGDKVIVYS